jgi:hypothetical protein
MKKKREEERKKKAQQQEAMMALEAEKWHSKAQNTKEKWHELTPNQDPSHSASDVPCIRYRYSWACNNYLEKNKMTST